VAFGLGRGLGVVADDGVDDLSCPLCIMSWTFDLSIEKSTVPFDESFGTATSFPLTATLSVSNFAFE
jgi:hypothetical protein